MAQQLTCPRGHQWQTPASDPPAPTSCPVCGDPAAAPGDTALSGASLPDDLPPPPRPVAPDPPTLASPAFPRIPGYEVLGELGRGGMGVVYQARQLSLNRGVALKMLLSGAQAGPEELARFKAEAEAVARLQHPNIVQVYDIGEHEGRLFCCLEYVDGGSLHAKLDGGPLEPGAAARLVETLAHAMHAAHQKGIVHRDLKPANVLLTADGTPKVSDFGLAKYLDRDTGQTRSGAIVGTPSYMAPEQVKGSRRLVTPATDVYALGAILYELLTGRPPFRGENTFATLEQVLSTEPTAPSRLRPGVPRRLEEICLRCLEKHPAHRHASARDLADDLHRFLEAGGRSGAGQKGWARVVLIVLAAYVGVVIAFFLLYNYWPPVTPTTRNTGGPPATASGPVAAEPAWETFTIGAPGEKFDRIAFPTRSVGYAASRAGVYETADGGKNWARLAAPVRGRVHVLHFTDEKNGWIGTDQLRQTADGGATWATVPLPDGMRAVTGFAASPDGGMFAGGTGASGLLTLYRKPPGGGLWQKLAVPPGPGGESVAEWFLGDLAVPGPRQAVAVLFHGTEEGGAVFRTTDGGDTWTLVLRTEQDLYRVRFAGSEQGWLAGGRGALWKTDNGGADWVPQANPQGEDGTVSCLAVSRDGLLGVAALWHGRLLLGDGRSWRVVEDGPGYSMPDAAVVDDGCAFVLGAEGTLVRYTDPRVPAP